MAPVVQNLIVLALVAACGGWTVWQGVRALSGKKSRLGSCCSKGCSAQETKPQTEKVHFLPADMLRKR
jgi:hypothetical protein